MKRRSTVAKDALEREPHLLNFSLRALYARLSAQQNRLLISDEFLDSLRYAVAKVAISPNPY
ncbi:hypothetical protein MCP1_910002 [Candidatus Terasakiella magnetica]|nr:hypothetical protein MCP1_910002 [Candidatus Terasakiella magnetica]